MKRINWIDEKNIFVSWDLIKQSFQDLYHAHKPRELDQFTEWFISKYKLSKDLKDKLMNLV